MAADTSTRTHTSHLVQKVRAEVFGRYFLIRSIVSTHKPIASRDSIQKRPPRPQCFAWGISLVAPNFSTGVVTDDVILVIAHSDLGHGGDPSHLLLTFKQTLAAHFVVNRVQPGTS